MKINQLKPVQVDAQTLAVQIKVRDRFNADLLDQDKQLIKSHEGDVPTFFPEGGGDYLVLDIDIDTGRITNWKAPTQEQLEAFINGSEQ